MKPTYTKLLILGLVIAILLIVGAVIKHHATTVNKISTGSNGFAVNISGNVPVICKADLIYDQPTVKTVTSGEINEFCNNPHGEQIFADYAFEQSGALLTVDGNSTQLDASGSVLLSNVNHANIAVQKFTVNLSSDQIIDKLHIRVVPLQN